MCDGNHADNVVKTLNVVQQRKKIGKYYDYVNKTL